MSLVVKSLSYLHPDKEPVFENLSFAVGDGEHVSIVGNNGTGKSTLLALAAGKLRPAAGEVIAPEKLWLVPQQLGSYDDHTVAAVLGIEPKLQALGAILAGDAAQEHFDVLQNDWQIEEKLQHALQTWGVGHLSAGTSMAALSGGEKTKVFLAGMELFNPALILLDEPTNHLDLTSRERLYHFVQTTRTTLVVVSHDRRLLNYTDKTFELDRSAIDIYGGNYDFYEQQKMIHTTALQAQEAVHEKALRQTQERSRQLAAQRQKKEARGRVEGKSGSLPRIVAGGLKSKAEQTTARSAELAREKSTAISAGLQRVRAQLSQLQVLRIDLGASALHPGKILVDAKNIIFSYGNRALWPPLSFQLRSGMRMRISGRNGSGKTTLLKLLTGMLEPRDGQLMRAAFNYLYLDQDYSLIRPERSVFEQLSTHNGRNLHEHELRSLLIYAQFPQESWDRKCEVLSGGEKMKLSLLCLSVHDHTPDLLILDEPTNNLDLRSLAVLAASVSTFSGTLLLISHDEYFVGQVGIEHTVHL